MISAMQDERYENRFAALSPLDQAFLADFISSGSFARHLNQVRIVYRARRNCLLNMLREHFGEVNMSGHHGGMHVMWNLPESSLSDLGYPALTEEQIREGIARVARALI